MSWCAQKFVFHAAHVLLARGRLLGEAARGEEQAGGDGGEPFIVNRELCSHRFLLGVLETIYVLGDAWVFGPPAEGGREEGDNVGGLEAAAAALEACEKVTERHLVVEGRLFFQWVTMLFVSRQIGRAS